LRKKERRGKKKGLLSQANKFFMKGVRGIGGK
jgi:hypothetical protein